MNRKLNSIKPYIKFHLQRATGQPIKDSDIDILCNNGEMVSVADVGEGYVLVSKTGLKKREDFFGGEE